MNKFKDICMQGHTQRKAYLHNLYTDRQVYISSLSSSEQPIEEEKLFVYRGVSFQFYGTGFRTPERTVLIVWAPEELCAGSGPVLPYRTAYEDWLLRLLSEPVNKLSEEQQNDHKDEREKAEFSMQTAGSVVIGRNGCLYREERHAFQLRIKFRFPLINGNTINGKSSVRAVKQLLDCICSRLEQMDKAAMEEHIRLYANQLEIRRLLRKSNLLAFVADGSILPREGDTEAPMERAVPFLSPESLRVTMKMPDGGELTGMGIKRGVTIITGGGYSGKSTLLDSLEQGIYFHVGGDGREYVITDETACKVYAEDGRTVSATDLSPFFSWLPGGADIHAFHTPHASGSVSQAVNIIEAVYGGCSCLLIDEDTSATNFMIRDEAMRRLVKKEPIVPFTDRVTELSKKGVSTVLVIGGSSEYLKYADCVLLLEDYMVSDRTEEVLGCREEPSEPTDGTHTWMEGKLLPRAAEGFAFSGGECVQIENARYIRIGCYVADITRLTAMEDADQINSLTWLLEKLLTEEGRENVDLNERCRAAAGALLSDTADTVLASGAHDYELRLEQVRGLDLLMAACRLRK